MAYRLGGGRSIQLSYEGGRRRMLRGGRTRLNRGVRLVNLAELGIVVDAARAVHERWLAVDRATSDGAEDVNDSHNLWVTGGCGTSATRTERRL